MTNLFYKEADVKDGWIIALLRKDPDVYLNLHNCQMFSSSQAEKWLENLPSTSRRIVVTTCDTPGSACGLIRIDNIDRANSCCEIGLDILKDHRGKGYAKIIYKWLLEYLFYQQNFNQVYLEVLETNEIAYKLYQKLGFREDGRLRQRVFRNGKYIDSIYMSLLRSEYNEIKALYDNTAVSFDVEMAKFYHETD